MSSVSPNDSTRSFSRVSDSTDHASSSFADGRRLQIWLTPNPAMTRRMASESPCCVPAFIRALRDAAGARLRLPRDLGLDHLFGDRADRHAASREANELASIHRYLLLWLRAQGSGKPRL